MKSPLKQEVKGKEDQSSKTVTKEQGRVGKYAATKTTTSVREVKKAAEGAKVGTKQVVPGMANRTKKPRSAWKGSDASLAEHNKKKRAEWDAQDKKAMEAAKKAPEVADKASEQSASGTTSKVELEKSAGSPGTRSSTFKPWEQRQNLRRDRIVVNKEKLEGRRGVNNALRFVKNSAGWSTKTRAEKKAIKNEIKYGKAKGQTESLLSDYGEDFGSNTEQFRKMKLGQGVAALAKVQKQIKNPEEVADAMMGQGYKNLNPTKSSGFTNLEGVQKEVKAGSPREVTAEEQKSLPDFGKTGVSTESTTSSKSTENSNTPNSDMNAAKASNRFAEMMANKDKVLGAKPSDYKSKFAKPAQSAPTAESKFTRGEKMMEEETPLKMKKSSFGMKGFGSKSGYNFNKNK
jgi:hypothetical protein